MQTPFALESPYRSKLPRLSATRLAATTFQSLSSTQISYHPLFSPSPNPRALMVVFNLSHGTAISITSVYSQILHQYCSHHFSFSLAPTSRGRLERHLIQKSATETEATASFDNVVGMHLCASFSLWQSRRSI